MKDSLIGIFIIVAWLFPEDIGKAMGEVYYAFQKEVNRATIEDCDKSSRKDQTP
tara:strand:+ start:298 stop:459 length:162 start_codon:yes stop_codon:yes gene_type:complete